MTCLKVWLRRRVGQSPLYFAELQPPPHCLQLPDGDLSGAWFAVPSCSPADPDVCQQVSHPKSTLCKHSTEKQPTLVLMTRPGCD